jgi:dTMP kinase
LRNGFLIAFEGPEGAGKSTQQRLAAEALLHEGRAVRTTAEPGGTSLGQEARRVLLEPRDPTPAPLAELFLYLADRAQHVAEVIQPALDAGAIVLTDRFSGSTIAYQGYGRGLDLAMVEQADAWARGAIVPDLTILLDCPIRLGLERALGADRFHAEAEAFHDRVRAGFLTLAARGRWPWRVIDATGAKDDVHHQIMQAIRTVIARRGGDDPAATPWRTSP